MSVGRYHPYSEYKDSGITWMGEIPTHWSEVRFKHVLSDKKKTLRPDLPAGSISFGRVVYKDAEILSNETKASYQEVLSGEFLVNPLNLNYDLMSLRTALSSIDVVVSTGYIVLQSNGRLHPNYTRWLLQQFDVAHMKTLGAGVRQTINFADIGNSFFFEPSLPEQTQIAAFLDHETAKIDRLIEKQQALIRLLKEKRQAVISLAVTKGLNPHAPLKDSGIEWLGQVPRHWEVKPLKYFGAIISGFAFKSEAFVESGIRVLKIANIQTATLDWTEESFLPEIYYKNHRDFAVHDGDIVFALTRPIISTGIKAAIADIGKDLVLLNQRNAIFRPNDKLNKRFLFHVLFSDSFRIDFENKIDFTGQQPNISPIDIANISIPFPEPTEQVEIGAYLDAEVEKFALLNSNAKKGIELLQERRTALISAAVTGKIDVRHWQPPAVLESSA